MKCLVPICSIECNDLGVTTICRCDARAEISRSGIDVESCDGTREREDLGRRCSPSSTTAHPRHGSHRVIHRIRRGMVLHQGRRHLQAGQGLRSPTRWLVPTSPPLPRACLTSRDGTEQRKATLRRVTMELEEADEIVRHSSPFSFDRRLTSEDTG